MATPPKVSSVRGNPELLRTADGHRDPLPPRSPPVVMNLPPPEQRFSSLFEALFDSDDEGDWQDSGEPGAYLAPEFTQLFCAHGSDRPESLAAWLACLPPLAHELYTLTVADLAAEIRLQRAMQVIGEGGDIASSDSQYGRSVLHWCCMLVHQDLVALLMPSVTEAHLHQRDDAGHSVLGVVHRFRTIGGTAQLIDLLLSAGASLDMLPCGGAELLYRRDLSVALVRRLLHLGVDVDGGGAFSATPLLAGCGSVDWGSASVLLDFHADVLRRGAFGTTVLHNPRIPVWLAEQFHRRGAGVNATDLLGDTPLMLACAHGNLPLVRWLIAKGARIDAVADDGRTVRDHAAQGGASVVQCLMQHLPAAQEDTGASAGS